VSRSDIIDKFLEDNGWKGAKRIMLAGDASFRRYERLFLHSNTAVLMDALPDKEDIRPFMKIAKYLIANNLSAPHILASDTENSLLLVEDLGDDLFARVLEKEPHRELELYIAAADVLVQLFREAERKVYSDIPVFDIERMLQQVLRLPEWFIPMVSGEACAYSLKKEYLELWENVLSRMPEMRQVMVLYDFHAENLLWLSTRERWGCTGLLDFQDAMIGSPAYDMVSFLEDARRDVSAETVAKTIEYYLEQTSIPKRDFMLSYHIMGAQRNFRIIGTFARLSVRDRKLHYLSYMPRVWRHIEYDLSHPLLAPLKDWIEKNIKLEWRIPK